MKQESEVCFLVFVCCKAKLNQKLAKRL